MKGKTIAADDQQVADGWPDLRPEAYGPRLKAAREAIHRTQLWMIQEIGCSHSAYTSWEQGRHKPLRRDQEMIEALTGRSRDYFLGSAVE